MGRQDKSARRAVFLWVLLPAVVAVGLLCAGVFGVILPAYGEGLLQQKREAIRQLTNSAHSILAGYRRRVRDGELAKEEAQQRALRQIRRLRYGPAGKSYFWVQDLDHRMLTHPYRPDLEGRDDLEEFTDRSGKRVFAEFSRVAGRHGGGYVRYDWQWQDDPNRIEPKLSYVRLFEPWGWVVGTGMYLDDVEAELAAMTWRMAWIMAAIVLVVGGLLTVVAIRAAVIDRRRIEAQRGRARSEARYRALVDNASEGIALVSDGVLTFANDAMARLTERAPEQLVGTPVEELLCDDQAKARVTRRVGGDEEAVVRERTRLQTASGGVREVFWSCGPIHTTDGEARILIVHDLTEQHQAQRQLEVSRSRLAAIYHNDAVGIAVIGPEGRFQQVNERWCRMIGYSEEELIGTSFLDVTHPEDRDASRQRVETLLRGAAWTAHGEKRYVRKDGEVIWGDLSISVIRNADGAVEAVVGMVVDVSERKSLEAQLIQSQKMEAVGQLAGGVAHDFNNQLTVIQGYTSLLLRSLPADDPRHAQVLEVHRAGERSRRLTSQLLAFGRKQVLRAEPLDPCGVLDGLEQTLSRILGEPVRVVVRCGDEVSNVSADRSQLEQAVINLAINARDAMPEGGTLTLQTREEDVSASRAAAAGIAPGRYVVLEATDTGVGMVAEVAEHRLADEPADEPGA